jgi:AraC-like DNA-binding protein
VLIGSDVVSQAAQHLPMPDVMEVLKAYLREHLAEQIRIKHLASLVALSPFYFVRTFKAHVGVPPHQYLMRVRLERASELLAETSLTVTQICHRVGFGSLSHFINTFRRHTGLSPLAFRQAARGETGALALASSSGDQGDRRATWAGAQDRTRVEQERAIRPGALFS